MIVFLAKQLVAMSIFINEKFEQGSYVITAFVS